MALVDHATGAPYALLNLDDEGGELAATQDLLGRSDIGGKVITLDALHTVRGTARLVTERCGAEYVFTVKGNAPETFGILDSIDWERDATGSFAEDLDKVHGRLERRSISVLTPPKGLVNYPGISQIARVTRYREPLKKGPDDAGKGEGDHTETVYLITSPRRGRRVAGGTAPPEPRPLGGGKLEPSPERLRLRRGRLHGPQGQRSSEPGQPQQHRARGDLRQPPRGGEPRRDPAPAAARPQRGHRRPDPALTRP